MSSRSWIAGPMLGLLASVSACSQGNDLRGSQAGGSTPMPSGGGGNTGGMVVASCASRPPAPPAPTGDVVRDTAVAATFASLDEMLGRFLRGDSPIYAGTASASENLPSLGPLAFSSSDAVAAVTVTADTATLTVASPADHERILFVQQRATPGLTYVGDLFPDGTFPGGMSPLTCVDCVPDLFANPATLAWSALSLHFAGEFFPDGEVSVAPYDINTTASLEARSPCALTWEQDVALTGGASSFTVVGGELVYHQRGQVQTIEPHYRMCDGQVVPYTMDVYVNRSNLFDYGVRNFVPGTPQPYCGPA